MVMDGLLCRLNNIQQTLQQIDGSVFKVKDLVAVCSLVNQANDFLDECNVTKRSSGPTWERQECGGDKHRARDLRDADTDARIARVPSGDNLQGYTFVWPPGCILTAFALHQWNISR